MDRFHIFIIIINNSLLDFMIVNYMQVLCKIESILYVNKISKFIVKLFIKKSYLY